jgi:hypothetical protein
VIPLIACLQEPFGFTRYSGVNEGSSVTEGALDDRARHRAPSRCIALVDRHEVDRDP